jgi:glycosyltransferase involved in cell wall biosynthesis
VSVSAIIPTYNRRELLPRAIDSVLAQKTSSNVECIVVDDGSEDGTADLVKSRYPDVRLIEQSNRGVSAARNVGINEASHDWVAFLDSDDEWMPNKLDSQLRHLDECGLLVSHTEEIWIRNGTRVNPHRKHAKRGGWIFQHCIPLCAISPSSVLMHRDVIDAVGEFDESLPACEDYDYWLRLTCQFEVAFHETPAVIKHGGHQDQLSRQHWGMDRFRVQALEKILDADLTNEDRSAARRMLRQKLRILLIGARKRANQQLVEACESRLRTLDSHS